MNHPLTIHNALLGSATGTERGTEETLQVPSYRSEAFPEDLGLAAAFEPETVSPRYRRYVALVGLLLAAPLGLALVGAMVALFGHPI